MGSVRLECGGFCDRRRLEVWGPTKPRPGQLVARQERGRPTPSRPPADLRTPRARQSLPSGPLGFIPTLLPHCVGCDNRVLNPGPNGDDKRSKGDDPNENQQQLQKQRT